MVWPEWNWEIPWEAGLQTGCPIYWELHWPMHDASTGEARDQEAILQEAVWL